MRNLVLGALLGAALLTSASIATDASACGGFFSPRPSAERRPSLSYEQALIIHDAAKGREHFIREVVFRASDEPFGFVVPTPTLPEVAKVAKSPFASLRERFPFQAEPPGGKGRGIGLGSEGGFGHGAGVAVLDVKKVGSFTAFVLAADDAGALSKWLKDNGLVSTPEADLWLAHYVRAKFYYVAMRYDPPPKDPKAKAPAKPLAPTKAETVRISFDSARPYYPYYEPDKPAGAPDEPRLLELWLATQGPVTQPVAARTRGESITWVRPFAEGQRYGAVEARQGLTTALATDAALLPTGELRLQRFMDQKRKRSGFGDVVFVPEGRDPADAATEAALRKLAPVLDASLLPPEAK